MLFYTLFMSILKPFKQVPYIISTKINIRQSYFHTFLIRWPGVRIPSGTPNKNATYNSVFFVLTGEGILIFFGFFVKIAYKAKAHPFKTDVTSCCHICYNPFTSRIVCLIFYSRTGIVIAADNVLNYAPYHIVNGSREDLK